MDKSAYTDEKLIRDYQQGDEQCFEILLYRHKDKIFGRILPKVRYNRTLAEEYFQAAFFKAIHALKDGKYEHDEKFVAWMDRIATNLIIDDYRRKKKMRAVTCVKNREGEYSDIFDVIRVQDDNDTAEETIVKSEDKNFYRKELRKLILQLPEAQREVLMMRLYFDMSFNEIADMMDVNLNTALGRMRYALIRLREIMDREGITLKQENEENVQIFFNVIR